MLNIVAKKWIYWNISKESDEMDKQLQKVIQNHLPSFLEIAIDCCGFLEEDMVGKWLMMKNSNLNNKRPIDLIDTKEGVKTIYELISMIQEGEINLH